MHAYSCFVIQISDHWAFLSLLRALQGNWISLRR